MAEWPRNGLTQEGYCTQHGISVGSLQRWRQIFEEDAAPEPRVSAQVSEFVPVTLVGESPTTASVELTLVLPEGLRLEIGSQCPAETLKRVLGVLRERA